MKINLHARCLIACLVLFSLSGPPTFAHEEASISIRSFGPSALIQADGSLWVWGNQQSVPTQVHGLSDVQALFANRLVMLQDGSVWQWRYNASQTRLEAHPLDGLRHLSNVYQTGNRTVALDTDGQVYTLPAWWRETTVEEEITPISGIDKVVDYSDFYDKTTIYLFLREDGSVWHSDGAWQQFERIAGLDDVVALSEQLILKADGTVWSLSVANGTEDDRYTITINQVAGLENIRSIRSTKQVYLAIDGQARLWFWGSTRTGYSDGTTLHRHAEPVLLTGIDNVKAAYVIERYLLAHTHDGQLLSVSINRENMPPDSEFELIASDIIEIQEDYRHLILKDNNGRLLGWGVNKDAQLGIGDYEFMYDTPVPLQRPVSLSLNGEAVAMHNGVILRNGLAFVPVRSVFEKMGAELSWDMIAKVVTIERQEPGEPSLTIELNFDTGEVHMNGEVVQLTHKPFIVQGTSYLPLRFISESLGAQVDWQESEGHIEISL